MAIAPRTIIRNPALLALTTLAVTAVAGFGLWVMTPSGGCGYVVEEVVPTCHTVASSDDQSMWNESDFVEVVACFDATENHHRALSTARAGLLRYPSSESLLNLRGYHEIELEQYENAVDTLRNGLSRVTPTNGVMENNLAWAGLWAPRKMDLYEARRLYVSSLSRDPSSCEAIHTGMWTEFAIASTGSEHVRRDAVGRYDALRARYNGCEQRMTSARPETVTEVVGTATMDFGLAAMPGHSSTPDLRGALSLGREAIAAGREAGMSPAELCASATPFPYAQSLCQQMETRKVPCRR